MRFKIIVNQLVIAAIAFPLLGSVSVAEDLQDPFRMLRDEVKRCEKVELVTSNVQKSTDFDLTLENIQFLPSEEIKLHAERLNYIGIGFNEPLKPMTPGLAENFEERLSTTLNNINAINKSVLSVRGISSFAGFADLVIDSDLFLRHFLSEKLDNGQCLVENEQIRCLMTHNQFLSGLADSIGCQFIRASREHKSSIPVFSSVDYLIPLGANITVEELSPPGVDL